MSRKRHSPKKPNNVIRSFKSKEFRGQTLIPPEQVRREEKVRNRCKNHGFAIPWQFNNWQHHWNCRANFLNDFEEWLSNKIEARGGIVPIITDVDSDIKPDYQHNGSHSHQEAFERNELGKYQGGWSDDDADYWNGNWHGGYDATAKTKPKSGFTNYWRGGYKTPNPTIAAPSGHSGINHFVL